MSEPKYSTTAKILKYLAYIVMGAGMILTMFGISSIFYGTQPPFLDTFTMIVLGILLLILGVPLLTVAQQGIIKPEFAAVTLLRCTSGAECKYTKARKFERGDFVFKELEDLCEKCNSKLHIAAIIEVDKTSSEEKVETPKELGETKETEDIPKPQPPQTPPP